MPLPFPSPPIRGGKDRLTREFELFEKLVGLNPTDRAARLGELAETDAGAAERMSKMLLAHQRTNYSGLDRPWINQQQQSDATMLDAIELGGCIGPYKILQSIGFGGMGQVFMAQQEQPIARRVAIKMLHSHLNSKNVLARFEAERAALSRLNHRGIAQILDAGQTESNRSYFVMELVRGKPITEYCDHERVDVPQRLVLFEELCRAIHHAHQKSIIHRDIKPSNVLVAVEDGLPTIKVIDFGIAKAVDQPLTDQTVFTRFGELIGTPVYMSPEQLQSGSEHVDIRSDVYALGGLLNELLTGFPPFQIAADQSLLQTLEQIRNSEPSRPSHQVTTKVERSTVEEIADRRRLTRPALERALRGELDWICMKALEKSPSQRYDSAAAMAADIRRFLNNEPIEAAAPTLIYRASKLFVKHRAVSILSAISLTILVLGAAVSSYLAVTAHYANERLTRQSAILEQEIEMRKKTELRLKSAQKSAKQLARKRQNEAAIERSISEFLFSASRRPENFGAALMVAAECRRDGNPILFNQSMVSESSDLKLDPILKFQTKDDATMSLDIVPRGERNDGETLAFEEVKIQFSFGGTVAPAGCSPPPTGQTMPNERDILKQRIELLRLIETNQRKEFGDTDSLVGETLFQRAVLHQQASQRLEGELAATKALVIFEQSADDNSDNIQASQKLLNALAGQVEEQNEKNKTPSSIGKERSDTPAASGI